MKSMMPRSSASLDEYALAWVTVASRASALRSRRSEIARMKARVSSMTLRSRVEGRSSPEPLMGEAAPMLVVGSMTAKLAAAVMKVPAEAACAPEGVT